MENNNQTILTDEELEQVVETLADNRNETDDLMEAIEKEHENDDNSNAPLEEGEGEYMCDGTIMEHTEKSNIINFEHFNNIDNSMDDIIKDSLKENLTENYEIDEEEAIKFISVISRVRAKENFDIYPGLPKKIQNHISQMIADENVPKQFISQYRQSMAKMIIDELLHDTELDTLSIDLEKAMKELLPSPLEMYSETNRDYIENEFLTVAEKIKDTEPNKARNLLNMRQGFIDAYTFEPMYKVLTNRKILKNLKRIEVMWSRVCNEYFNVASVCKFNLYPIDEVFKALMNLGFTKIQAYRITSLFVYTYTDGITNCRNEKDYNDIYRNSFANYFENNIKNLSMSPDLISDFSKMVRENFDKLNVAIEEAISARDAELSNKK